MYRQTALVEASQWHHHGDHPAVREHPVNPEWGRIDTREGRLTVKPGAWIVGPGADGGFLPVGDAEFRATHEPAEQT